MSVRQSLGKVAVVPKGSWDGTNTYEFLDIVKYGGGSYIARKDVPIGTAITNTEYWVSLVDKGEIGDDGVSPSVTVTPITGGHRVTITDATHPQGQTIDVMDGEDGAGAENAVRYDEQMALTDTQKATARSNIGAGTYSKPSGGIPASDLASDVKASLGKADTALQEHQSLASYRTASAQDEIDNAQNVEIRKKANSADLAAVATSGSYNDLADKPSIPSLAGYATEAWVNNKGYLTLADLPVYNGGVS